MTENKDTIPSIAAVPERRKTLGVYLASALGGLFLAGLIWQFMAVQDDLSAAVQPVAALGVLLGAIFLAGLSGWALGFVPLPKAWQHRGAALVSLLVGAAVWLILEVSTGGSFGLLVAAEAGAIIGGMLFTWMQEGVYENNQPPSAQIRQEVIARHKELIGTPPRGNLPKRIFDILLAGFGLLISAPIWILITVLIWFEDPGPVVFIKNSVGKGGPNFHQFKFRTMVSGAEIDTGPIPARESDSRVLKSGRFLRKTALDELPQLFNILIGEMSFVGPRPQRTVLVYLYLRELPGFADRAIVLPGLAGLAQVAGDYFVTPRQKLRYDRIYAQHASLGFDLKLLAIAFALVFWLRWQKDSDGKIPRSWLHDQNT